MHWHAVAAVLIPLLILAIKPASNNEVPETLASGITADQKNYLGEAEWYVNTAFQPTSNDARQGKEYREVMLARLANASLDLKTRLNEMANLYQNNSQEWMNFVFQSGNCQQSQEKAVVGFINSHCESFREAYRKGVISQAAYDSLEWIVSPTITT